MAIPGFYLLGLTGALLFVPPAPGLRLDRAHVLEAAGTAGEPLGPQPPQLLDIALLERPPLFPLAQGLTNHFAGGRILAALDRAPDQAGHRGGEGDAELLDVCRG